MIALCRLSCSRWLIAAAACSSTPMMSVRCVMRTRMPVRIASIVVIPFAGYRSGTVRVPYKARIYRTLVYRKRNKIPTKARSGQILDRHRLNRISRLEAEYARVEVEFGVERTLDILGLAKAVLLAFKRQIRYWQTFRSQGIDQQLGLTRRHNLVFQPLKQYHGTFEPIAIVNRRALAIDILALGVRANQPVKITRLELMCILCQRGQIADAIVARASAELIAKGQGAQRGIAARAAAGDRQPLAIHFAALCQIA